MVYINIKRFWCYYDIKSEYSTVFKLERDEIHQNKLKLQAVDIQYFWSKSSGLRCSTITIV